jgi:hypothetical protein
MSIAIAGQECDEHLLHPAQESKKRRRKSNARRVSGEEDWQNGGRRSSRVQASGDMNPGGAA